jgi:spore coat polysaccharide biosynthesis predicted glycosyltransferase SpsG
MRGSDSGLGVGIVVDAGPKLGYGHAVRCLRLAQALEAEVPVTFYPMSEACESFLRESSTKSEIRNPKWLPSPLWS